MQRYNRDRQFVAKILWKLGISDMKLDELKAEAQEEVKAIVEKWVSEVEQLPTSADGCLDANLRRQSAIQRKYKALVMDIMNDEKNRKQ